MVTNAIPNTTNHAPQIVIKRKYKASISDMWEAITNPASLSSWLMETKDFSLVKGQKFQFKTDPRGKFDGTVHCEMLEIDEPTSLIYSWQATGMPQPTIVRWTLQALDDHQTLLQLEHFGFMGFNGWLTRIMLGAGWKRLLSKKLKAQLGI